MINPVMVLHILMQNLDIDFCMTLPTYHLQTANNKKKMEEKSVLKFDFFFVNKIMWNQNKFVLL